MLYREMASTGDRLSILGFGCMRLPGRGPRIDEKRARAQLLSAVERGVNYIDTAFQYHVGASEPFVGKVVSEAGIRDRVNIATKLPPWNVRVREDMDRILGVQLQRLRTDRIDYYLVHSLAARSFDKMLRLGVLEFLERARDDGRIVNAGFSFHGDPETFKRIVDAHPWQFCQIQFNYLDQEHQAGVEGLRYAARRGLGVVVMEPLRGGNLARPLPEPVRDVLDRAPTHRTPAEWALRWVWNHPEVHVVLSGMNDERHIDENLAVADEALPGSLTEDELRLVDRARDAWRDLMRADCTGCGYCMPCPEGVDIPTCFELYNTSRVLGDRRGAHGTYLFRVAGLSTGRPAGPSLCVKCRRCEKACPQDLPVSELLEEVAAEFDGPLVGAAAWLGHKLMALQRLMLR